MNKKKRIIKGGFYLTIVNVLSQFLAIIVNIVLARLLMPEEFGLVALTTTYIGFITLFTNMGFGSSIIHYSNTSEKQLSSIFWVNLSLSIFSFLIIILSVPFSATFYNEPKLPPIVFVSAFGILFSPLYIVPYKLMERELEFHKISKINLLGILSGAIAAIIGAYVGLGVYALVLQSLVTSAMRFILILLHKKWYPKFHFNFNEVKHMIWYSMKYKASQMSLYLERNIDYLILGKFFSSVILGYYAFSYNIMYTPVKRISSIFSDVLFPSFSSFKKEKEKIINGYFKSINLIAIISIPAMTILAFNAEVIIQTVFGNKWNNAIPIVEILCFAGAIQSISQFGGVVFPSIGKPEITFYISITRAFLTAMAIIGGVQLGMIWVAYLLVVAKWLSFILFLIVLYHYLPFPFIKLFNSLKGPFISFITLSIIKGLHSYGFLNVSPWLLLIIMLLDALVIFYLFHKDVFVEIVKIILEKKNK